MKHIDAKRVVMATVMAGIVLLAVSAGSAQAAPPVDPADDVASGMPLSIWKTVLLVAVMMVVAASGNWLAGDVAMLQKQTLKWQGVMLGAAVAALVAVLAVPWIIGGAGVALLIVGGVLGWYASWRNPQLPARASVFTAAHVDRLKDRLLRRSREGESAAERAVHVAARSQLTEQLKLVYMKTNDFPIRMVPQGEQQERDFSRAEEVLHEAMQLGAEELYLVPQGQELLIRYRGDGVLRDGGKIESGQVRGVVQFMKQLAELDLEEHRKPQNGRLMVLEGDKSTYLTVEAAGSVRGEQILVRLHPRELIQMRLEDSGMRPEQVELLRGALNHPEGGVVLMGGPQYNRRIISMYAAMREFDLFSKNVMAVTSQINIEYADIQQVEAGRQGGAEALSQAIQGALRADPDVILVETVDGEAPARMMMQGAAAGKMMIGGIVSNDAAENVSRFISAGIDVRNLAGVIRGSTNQRLMRKLCPGCREAYRPNPDFLRKANLQASQVDVLYREPKSRPVDKHGNVLVCPVCRNEGYSGRIFIYEVVVFDDQSRGLLASGRSMNEVRAHLRKQGQDFLQEEGLRKVVSGETSVAELLRVLKPAK